MDFSLSTFIIYAVIFIILTIEFGVIIKQNYKRASFILKVWGNFTPLLFLEAVITIAGILEIYILLSYIPYLNKGWYNLIYPKGGNIILAPFHATTGYAAIAFLVLLLLFFPFMVEYEEKGFRAYKILPRQYIPSSIIFGLIHLIVGIPIAAAIALIFAGLSYSRKYVKTFENAVKKYHLVLTTDELIKKANEEALFDSTTLHTLCNTIIVITIIVQKII